MKLFNKVRAAFHLTVNTIEALTEAVSEVTKAQTQALSEVTKALQEHTSAIRAQNTTIKAIENNTKYVAISERHRLQREGRPHDFNH